MYYLVSLYNVLNKKDTLLMKLSLRLLTPLLMLASLVGAAGCSPSVMPSSSSSSERIPVEGKNVYFAAPLFSAAELSYNLKITGILEEYGYSVFLPQRDGYLAKDMEGLTEEEIVDKIFKRDVQEVRDADILFMILDGRVPDEGACVELGLAYSLGKRCYGFMTDSRVETANLGLNPLISGCMKKIFFDTNEEKTIASLRQYLEHHAL